MQVKLLWIVLVLEKQEMTETLKRAHCLLQFLSMGFFARATLLINDDKFVPKLLSGVMSSLKSGLIRLTMRW